MTNQELLNIISMGETSKALLTDNSEIMRLFQQSRNLLADEMPPSSNPAKLLNFLQKAARLGKTLKNFRALNR